MNANRICLLLGLLGFQQAVAQDLQTVTQNGNTTNLGIQVQGQSSVFGLDFNLLNPWTKQLVPNGFNFNISTGAADGSLQIPYSASAYPRFQNLGLVIDHNVGIGTTSPDQRLTVKGGGIGFDYNSTDKKLYAPADGVLEWMTHDGAGEHGFAVSHQGDRRVYLSTSGNSYINSGNLGIGTGNPQSKLDIHAAEKGWLINTHANAFSPGDINGLRFYSGYLGDNKWSGICSVAEDIHSNNTGLLLFTNQTEKFRITSAGDIGIGTASPKEKLSVNGKIRAHEIKVETAYWPDYVFQADYKLPSLKEIEQHIKENGHLSEIPSAREAETNGIALGEMNKLLLKKVEELTLHLIQKDKELKLQNAEMMELKKDVEELKHLIRK